MGAITVSVVEIRNWFGAALDTVERNHGPEVQLEQLPYWQVASPDAFDLSVAPELIVGDLADDVNDIRKDVGVPVDERSIYAWHLLDHLKGVLVALSASEHPGGFPSHISEGTV